MLKPRCGCTQRKTWSNIPVICSYTGEWICPKMPQNEERNISTGFSDKIVHLQQVLPPNVSILSSFSVIMASIAQQWVLVPRNFAALDFPRKMRLTQMTTPKIESWFCFGRFRRPESYQKLIRGWIQPLMGFWSYLLDLNSNLPLANNENAKTEWSFMEGDRLQESNHSTGGFFREKVQAHRIICVIPCCH